MDTKRTVDVSSYLLFEATGDSEALSDQNIAAQIPTCDEDDAQSCCYDASETRNVDDEVLINRNKYSDEKKEDEDEVGACVYGTSNNEEEDDDEMQEHQKVGVRVDSGQEKVDEMEKNRLFWEACLAS